MAAKPSLTAREFEVTAAAFKCFRGDPSLDYDKLAQEAGFKNAKTAAAVWSPIKKKLLSFSGKPNNGDSPLKTASASSAGGRQPAASKGASPKKRKTINDERDDEEDGGNVEQAGKKSPRKKAAVKGKGVVKEEKVNVKTDDDELYANDGMKKGIKEEPLDLDEEGMFPMDGI